MDDKQKLAIGRLFAVWTQTLGQSAWTARVMESREQFVEGQLAEMTRCNQFPDAEKIIERIQSQR